MSPQALAQLQAGNGGAKGSANPYPAPLSPKYQAGIVSSNTYYNNLQHPQASQATTHPPSSTSKPTANTGQKTNSYYPGVVQGASTGVSAQDLAAYNTYKNEATKDLSTLLNSYNATKNSLNSNYDTKENQLDSAKAAAQNTYNDNVTQQNQDLLRQDNQIRTGVHNAYQNLLNLLGAYGAGGSSVALQWAPTAAQHFQNTQMGDASQNAASNLRSLNTTWGNYENQYDQQKKQLADQRAQDLANADSQYNDTRAKLNMILGRINDQSVTPGDISSSLSGISVPNVNFVRPTYNGTTPVYNAPNLSTFEATTPAASFASPASTSNSSTTPALVYLLNQQKQQQQPTLA